MMRGRSRECLMAYLEDRHERAVVMANARQRAKDLALGHGAVTTKSQSPDGGAVTLPPAPHPCTSEEIQ